MTVCPPAGARSISRSVWERLGEAGPAWVATVLAVFERACHLVSADGDVVALVLPEIGDGPLNIVVAGLDPSQTRGSRWGQSGVFSSIEPGSPAHLKGNSLQVTDLDIALDGASIWDPCPGWERLRGERTTISGRLPLLRALALDRAPADSLLGASSQVNQDPGVHRREAWQSALESAVSEATASLAAGWEGDEAQLRAGAVRLAGLGAGLTPAGDDLMAGVMLWAWLAHPSPRSLCQVVLDAAAPRTTVLSAAFLRAAAGGQCAAAWHRLLGELSKTPGDWETPGVSIDDRLAAAVEGVLSHGHTSGADMLAGFLSLGQPEP